MVQSVWTPAKKKKKQERESKTVMTPDDLLMALFELDGLP